MTRPSTLARLDCQITAAQEANQKASQGRFVSMIFLLLSLSVIGAHLQVRDFVNRYMPAYKAYLPVMYDKGPSTGTGENFIIFEIDESRGLLQRKIPDV